jgi:uncharacterized Zn-finger protein
LLRRNRYHPATVTAATAMPDTSHPPEYEETIFVDQRVVGCDGGGGPLGHPLVYLKIADRDVVCPYCSRHFVLTPGAGQGEAH